MKRHFPTLAIALIAGAISAGAMQTLISVRADQSERVPPVGGIYTGPQWAQKVGDAVRSISTGNKGASSPANVGGSAVDGLEWIDDSSTPWIKKRYVNGGWAVEGALDPSDSSYVGVVGGGVASIASASTTDLGSVPQANVSITGTTTINSFGSSAAIGVIKIVRFAGALTLAYSSGLTVPGGYSISTAANDRAIVTHLGSGNWEVTHYTRASGIPVDVSAVGRISMGVMSEVDAQSAQAYGQAMSRASIPAYVAKATRAQNGTRTSGNATITSVANTTGFGVGMPVEATGVNAGCTIASFVANTSITLNSSSCVTSSGTSTVTVFLTGYGAGGDATTIGAPDCRGRALVGIPELSGVLSSTYYGTEPNAFNAKGGAASQSLGTSNLPPLTPAGSVSLAMSGGGAATKLFRSLPGVVVTASYLTGGGGTVDGLQAGTGSLETLTAGFAGSAMGGTSAAFSRQMPSLITECSVRIIP